MIFSCLCYLITFDRLSACVDVQSEHIAIQLDHVWGRRVIETLVEISANNYTTLQMFLFADIMGAW